MRVTARADEYLVEVCLRDQLIKTRPRQRPGGRSTDTADMPPGVEGYATRTVERMVAQAGCYGEHVGIYAQRLLDGDAPWMMMRSVYRLAGLAKRYGPAAAEAACARALDVDVINVSKIESMLVNATEKNQAVQAAAPAGTRRFARDPAQYAPATGTPLQVGDGRRRRRGRPAWGGTVAVVRPGGAAGGAAPARRAAGAARRPAQAGPAVAHAQATGAAQDTQAAVEAMHAAREDARAALEAADGARADADAAEARAQAIRDQADDRITGIRQQAEAAIAQATSDRHAPPAE